MEDDFDDNHKSTLSEKIDGKEQQFKKGDRFLDKLMTGTPIKDIIGLDNKIIDIMFGQAYQLYNTGKYEDASRIFQNLVMLNSTESKYMLGLAACYHMMKDYENAVKVYELCAMLDPKNPIPHYHSYDCFMNLGDKIAALNSIDMAIECSGDLPQFKVMKERAVLMVQNLEAELDKEDEANEKDAQAKDKDKDTDTEDL